MRSGVCAWSWPTAKCGNYEGEKGAERIVRKEFADGEVRYFEGEQDAERMVRVDAASL